MAKQAGLGKLLYTAIFKSSSADKAASDGDALQDINTVLFAVTKDGDVKVGLPPVNYLDNYDTRSAIVGKLSKISKIFFSPVGDLFVVRGVELYKGSIPSGGDQDWFSIAKRVGKVDWDKFKFLFFDPNGLLYGATYEGEFYKGPVPDNENVSWLYSQATKIGNGGWSSFHALFFDNQGILYAVSNNDELMKGNPPIYPDDDWAASCTTIGKGGWQQLTHFMAFGPDGNLWCVRHENGIIYKGPPPKNVAFNYMVNAEKLGYDYNMYPYLSFTCDKTVQSIASFEFLPDLGKIKSKSTEVVESQIYDNRKSSVPLKHTFTFSKTIKQSSTFSHEHGFTIAVGAEITFKTGIPFIAEGGVKISIDASTTHTWKFNETNETDILFSSSSEVQVPAKKAVHLKASIVKAEIDVPYRANIITLFGYKTTIEGTWNGVRHFDMMVTQEDYR